MSSVGVGRGGRFTKAQEGERGGIGLAMLTGIFGYGYVSARQKKRRETVYYTEIFCTSRFSFLASSLRDEWKKSSDF